MGVFRLFLHIIKRDSKYSIHELSKREFRTAHRFEFSQTHRYKNIELDGWECYLIISNPKTRKIFHLASYTHRYFIERVPTGFPLFERDLWTKGVTGEDNHLVARLKLKFDAGHFLMSKRPWLSRRDPEFSAPELFRKHYRVRMLSESRAGLEKLPPQTLEYIAQHPKVFLEFTGTQLFVEWPYVIGQGLGLTGVGRRGDKQSELDTFADFVFGLTETAPDLFAG